MIYHCIEEELASYSELDICWLSLLYRRYYTTVCLKALAAEGGGSLETMRETCAVESAREPNQHEYG